MFGKGNFDGQFRTKPTVSIRGASQSENREQLLKRAHDERLNREVIYNRNFETFLKIIIILRLKEVKVMQFFTFNQLSEDSWPEEELKDWQEVI